MLPAKITVDYATGQGRLSKDLWLRSDGDDQYYFVYATARNSDAPDGPLVRVRIPKDKFLA